MVDIAILGAGPIGLTLAVLLLKNNFSVALIDKQPPPHMPQTKSARVSALNLASLTLLENSQILQKLPASSYTYFSSMSIWEANAQEIHFSAPEIGKAHLGAIVDNALLQFALWESIAAHPDLQTFFNTHLAGCDIHDENVSVNMEKTTLQAKMVIGADGANSFLRQQLGITCTVREYQQTALTAIVKHERNHQYVARQIFTEQGPLAFLPLAENDMSVFIWSLPSKEAQRLQALTSEEFNLLLSTAFQNTFGQTQCEGEILAFPLRMQHAKHYVQEKAVILGDAAHTIHPMAGQGLNLGLADVVCLVDNLCRSRARQRDFTTRHALRQFERQRRAANTLMIQTIEVFHQLFTLHHHRLALLRHFGMSLVSRSQIKYLLMRQACGI